MWNIVHDMKSISEHFNQLLKFQVSHDNSQDCDAWLAHSIMLKKFSKSDVDFYLFTDDKVFR